MVERKTIRKTILDHHVVMHYDELTKILGCPHLSTIELMEPGGSRPIGKDARIEAHWGEREVIQMEPCHVVEPITRYDTSNKQLVGVLGNRILVGVPNTDMTKQEALVHAAWLVALADDNDEFPDLLEQVRNI